MSEVYMWMCIWKYVYIFPNLQFLSKFRKGTQRFLTAFAQAVYSKKKVNKNAHYQGNRAVLNHKMYFLFFSATAYSITCRYSSLFSCWMWRAYRDCKDIYIFVHNFCFHSFPDKWNFQPRRDDLLMSVYTIFSYQVCKYELWCAWGAS